MISLGEDLACLHSAHTLNYYSHTENCKEWAVLMKAERGQRQSRGEACVWERVISKTPNFCCVGQYLEGQNRNEI